jgi:hypothetical protein
VAEERDVYKHWMFNFFNRKFTCKLQNATKRWGAKEIFTPARFALLHVFLYISRLNE